MESLSHPRHIKSMIYRRDDLRLLQISGPDARSFLGGLITQRTDLAVKQGTYSALLTPQGKLLADFPLLSVAQDQLILALQAEVFVETLKKLNLFKLRSDVTLREQTDQCLISRFDAPPLTYADDRAPDLSHGLAALGVKGLPPAAFHQERARRGIPEGAHDLVLGKSTLLDEGMACAIDWQKGCYMGQEVTARMRYRALIKRVLVPYKGVATVQQALSMAGKKVGEVRSTYGGFGFAYVQKDFAGQRVEGLALGYPIGLEAVGIQI